MGKSEWYVLAVQLRKETFVERQLLSNGFEVKNPKYLKVIRHARNRKTAVRPLFPGYIFVRASNSQISWRKANCLPGSVGLIMFGDRPSSVNEEFVEEFLSSSNEDGLIETEQIFQKGDVVQAIGGPFDGILGRVVNSSDSERVTILMNALNREVRTTLPRNSLVIAA